MLPGVQPPELATSAFLLMGTLGVELCDKLIRRPPPIAAGVNQAMFCRTYRKRLREHLGRFSLHADRNRQQDLKVPAEYISGWEAKPLPITTNRYARTSSTAF